MQTKRPAIDPAGGFEAGASFEERLQRSGGGRPLPDATRAFMEPRFGADFSAVRLHTGGEAAQLNREISAQAFTHGRDIYLGAGKENVASDDGRRLLAHELTHVVQQGGAIRAKVLTPSAHAKRPRVRAAVEAGTVSQQLHRHLQALRIQRMVDEATFKANAGKGSFFSRANEPFKLIVGDLRDYHSTLASLWASRQTTASAFRGQLNTSLDVLHARCENFIRDHATDPRTSEVTRLRDSEIPDERERVNAMALDPNFSKIVGTRKPVGEAGTEAAAGQARPALLADAGIRARPIEYDAGGEHVIGHGMAVWARLDLGPNPKSEPDADRMPLSIHGATFEYWESVDVDYDFQAANFGEAALKRGANQGRKSKQWNDIFIMYADKATFGDPIEAAPPIEMGWFPAFTASRAGTLRGVKTVGAYDRPGVTYEPNRHIRRVLRFNIIFRDRLGGRRQMFATQTLKLDGNPIPALSTYVDSAGNAFGQVRTGGPSPASQDLPATDAHLATHGITQGVLEQNVPGAARAAVPAFLAQIRDGTAAAYNDREGLNEDTRGTTASISGDREGPGVAAAQYNIVGANNLPKLPAGCVYVEYALGPGGLLVAMLKGKAVVRMYYTDNVQRPVVQRTNMGAVVATRNLRQFASMPVDDERAHLPGKHELTTLGKLKPAGMTPAPDLENADVNSALARYQGQTKPRQIAERRRKAVELFLQRPDVPSYNTIKYRYQTLFGENFDDVLRDYYADHFRANAAAAFYAQLSRQYPRNVYRASFIADAYTQAHGAQRLAQVMLEAGGVGVLGDMQGDYRLDPAHVQAYFDNQFATHGMGGGFYRTLSDRYVQFPTYRRHVNDAYVRAFGQPALTAILAQSDPRFARASARDDADLTRVITLAVNALPAAAASLRTVLRQYPHHRERVYEIFRSIRGHQNVINWMLTNNALNDADPATDSAFLQVVFRDQFRGQNHDEAKQTYFDLRDRYPHFTDALNAAYVQKNGRMSLSRILAGEMGPGPAHALSPTDIADKKAFLRHARFTLTDFVPSSTDTGKFDATYNPLTGRLDIVIKMHYDFRDSIDASAADPTQLTWSPAAKLAWTAQHQEKMQRAWSRKFTIRCTKPGWGNITALPVLSVRAMPSAAGAHFSIPIYKSYVANAGENRMTASGKTMQSSSATGKVNSSIAELQEMDLADKVNDPAVHEYLHYSATRLTGSVAAYEQDRRRINALLGVHRIRFSPNADTVLPADGGIVNTISGGLKALDFPGALYRLHRLKVIGSTVRGEPDLLAQQRAARVQTLLNAAGVQFGVTLASERREFAGAFLELDEPSPEIQDTFTRNWTRISAAHEMGHMLGLSDEYAAMTSRLLAEKMIADGLLPPGTPLDHLQAAPTEGSAQKQHNFARLLTQAKVKAPDWNPRNEGQIFNASIMTSGYEVLPAHYVTMWEALGRMTSAAGIAPGEWQIE